MLHFLYISFFSNKEKFKKTAVKIFASALVPIIAFTGFSHILGDKVLKAEENPKYIAYTLPIYLAVATTYYSGQQNIDEQTIKTLESKTTIEYWQYCYIMNIYSADTVTRSWSWIGDIVNTFDDDFLHDILKANVRLVISHPKEYLTALFNITSIVWEIANPGAGGYVILLNDSEMEGKITRNTAFQGTWSTLYSTSKNPITTSILWRGGLWVFIGVLSAAVLMKKRMYNSLMAFVPVFIYALSLMLSCPAQDPRYVMAFLQIGIFVLTLAYGEQKQEKSENKQNKTKELKE